MDKNHQLSRQDASYLTNYLFSVENWGYYETLILGNCCRVLSPDLLFRYAKEALKKKGSCMVLYLEIDNLSFNYFSIL